jgi:hypothetical protein
MLVHSSIAELHEFGVHDRYCAEIDPATLAQINELIGPGWMPLALALQHYEACERLQLNDKLILQAGMRAGEKMGGALLVAGAQSAAADGSPWAVLGRFSRMGRRIYEGGTTQYVKLGARALLIEHLRNPLYALHYYRVAHGGFLRKSFGSLGVDIADVSFSAYRPERQQVDFHVSWR